MRNLNIRDLLQKKELGTGGRPQAAPGSHRPPRTALQRRLAAFTRRVRPGSGKTGLRGKRSFKKTARQIWSWTNTTAQHWRRIARNAGADSLGSLLTISVDDWTVRAVLVTGNRVRNWNQVELPHGVVSDGTVANRLAFERVIRELVASFYEGSRIIGRDVAVAIGGRTHVQARFTVAVDDETTLEAAVLKAVEERFALSLRYKGR